MSNFNVKWTATVLAIGLAFASLLVFFQFGPVSFTTNSLDFSSGKGSTKGSFSPTEIPNIVHFVHLVHDPSSNPTFEFPFRQFIAIYSAWYYLQPKTIYIHTNVERHLIDETLKRSKSPYTRAITKLPNLKFSHQTPPDHTKAGVAIDKLPNQSDFVRTVVLSDLGGIYLDEDSYVLRDLSPFRAAGFDNVVGMQFNRQ